MARELDELYPVEVGARLKFERTKIGLATQADAAAACGVSREMWGQYERGKTLPGSEALARFALLGGDVQHVLTGSMSINYTEDSPVSPISQGKRIARLRGGTSIESYAKMLEIDAATLDACERGIEPASASLLLSICRLTNANLDWLLRGVGRQEAKELDPLFLSLVSSVSQWKYGKDPDAIPHEEIRLLERELRDAERELRTLTKENADLRIEQAKSEIERDQLIRRIAELETGERHDNTSSQSFNQSQITNVAGRDVNTEMRRGRK